MEYKVNDLLTNINKFEVSHEPNDRYASFDYCYNYFHPSNNIDITFDMEKSCTALGFYLASWGMFRGSSFILQKSSKNFESIIEYIALLPVSVWEIDAGKFNEENIDLLIDIYSSIKERIIKGNNADLTLITKIMLGVFGSTPAFDKYFILSLKNIFKDQKGRTTCGFTRFNKEALKNINIFYNHNSGDIDSIVSTSKTIEFITGNKTNLPYTKSKVIDMYGFTKGLSIS